MIAASVAMPTSGRRKRALTHIIEHQRRQHEPEPGEADRLAAEMAHVRIECLGTRNGEHHGAQRQKRLQRRQQEEIERIERIDRPENVRVLQDAHDTERRDRDEIDHHDRPEQRSDAARARALDEEQEDQDRDRQRHHQIAERGIDDRQTLDRRQDRHRRRDHAVAIEQRRGEHAEQDDARRPALRRHGTADQGEQRKTAALALVVRLHDDRDIFERHDQHHRPEHEADRAHDVRRIEIERMMARKGLAEGVERAGTDVAEDDADRADGKLQQAFLAMPVAHGRCSCPGIALIRRGHLPA
jgi:hypothetical protein